MTHHRFVVFAVVAFVAVTIAAARSRRRTEITLVGELHGTNEIPREFGNLVHEMPDKAKGSLAIGLELPMTLQPVLDKAIHDHATCELLHDRMFESPSWQKINDGRSSEAMLGLICDLAVLAQQSRISLFVFDTETAERNQTMAKAISSRLEQQNPSQLLILVGNLHASTAENIPGYPKFHPMGWWLTQQGYRVRSFDVLYDEGDAWICTTECGVHQMKSRRTPGSVDWTKKAGYDDVLLVGRISASPPAKRSATGFAAPAP